MDHYLNQLRFQTPLNKVSAPKPRHYEEALGVRGEAPFTIAALHLGHRLI